MMLKQYLFGTLISCLLFQQEDFKLHFRNISRIMDCVGCDKCRLWGKLQVSFVMIYYRVSNFNDSKHDNKSYAIDAIVYFFKQNCYN